MPPRVQQKKWILYILWILALVGVLVGIWWYYNKKIDKINRRLDQTGYRMNDSALLLMARSRSSSDDSYILPVVSGPYVKRTGIQIEKTNNEPTGSLRGRVR